MSLSPILSTMPRCDTHPWSLLSANVCPQCIREAEAARIKTVEEQQEARHLQAVARVYAGRRAKTLREVIGV